MPLINGQKMACAPCIRGHRSTKCNHAADRVMVPVRKPGRPLSSCACPPGQSCACGGIKVAIPRKQKCKCGSDATNGDHEGHDAIKTEMPTPAPTPSELPVSPTRNDVFRIQKPAPRQNSRKHSFDPAHFDRIDPNSVNIVNGYHANGDPSTSLNGGMANGIPPRGPPTSMSGMVFAPGLQTTGFHPPNLVSYGPPVGYALVPIHPQVNGNHSLLPMAQRPPENYTTPPNGQMAPIPKGAMRSCCAPAPSAATQTQHLIQQQQQQPSEPPKKSCCGGGGSNGTSSTKANGATHQRALPNGLTASQLQPSFMDMKHQQRQQEPFAVSYANSTVFTYPPDLGTWNQPLNPEMWAQLQQGPSQPHPNGQAFPSSLPMTPNGSNTAAATSHECSCGPGCQCVGCLAHPFNSQTLQYVGAAWDYDVDVPYGNSSPQKAASNSLPPTPVNDQPAQTAQANSHSTHTNGHSSNTSKINGANGVARAQQQPGQAANPDNGGSPAQAQTPSDASGFNEELSASDFMFVNLPLYPAPVGLDGDSCGGSLAFCPCGDDCQCIGCVIHNARPLDTAGGYGEQ